MFLNEDSDGELKEYNDSHIFAISLVPIQVLRRRPENNDQDVIWRNELPSSVSLCRPVKLLFRKENTDLTRAEVREMDSQIQKLVPTQVNVKGVAVDVSAKLILSMVDTKVVNDLAGTSTQQCFICLRSGKRLNDSLGDQIFNAPDLLKCVFSPLHAQIRTLDCCLT